MMIAGKINHTITSIQGPGIGEGQQEILIGLEIYFDNIEDLWYFVQDAK